MRTYVFGLALGLTAALLSPGVAIAEAPPVWDHPGYDAEDSYYNPHETAINVSTLRSLHKGWSVPLRKASSCPGPSAPLVAAGRLFVTDSLGISAYRADSGKLLWRFDWPDPLDSDTPSMALSGNILIAADSDCNSQSDPDGTITALNAATGKVSWRVHQDVPIYHSVVDKGLVVVSGESSSDDPTTIAYHVSGGAEAWRKLNYESSDVSADGTVFLTSKTTTVATDVTTGRPRWSKPGPWQAEAATPTATEVLATSGQTLALLNAKTGATTWTAPGKATPLLATDGRRAYLAIGNHMDAVDIRSGKQTWTHQLSTEANQPVRAGGLLYTGSEVLSPATGTPIGPTYPAPMAIAGTHLYTVTNYTLTSYTP